MTSEILQPPPLPIPKIFFVVYLLKPSSECLVSYDPHFPGNDGTKYFNNWILLPPSQSALGDERRSAGESWGRRKRRAVPFGYCLRHRLRTDIHGNNDRVVGLSSAFTDGAPMCCPAPMPLPLRPPLLSGRQCAPRPCPCRGNRRVTN